MLLTELNRHDNAVLPQEVSHLERQVYRLQNEVRYLEELVWERGLLLEAERIRNKILDDALDEVEWQRISRKVLNHALGQAVTLIRQERELVRFKSPVALSHAEVLELLYDLLADLVD